MKKDLIVSLILLLPCCICKPATKPDIIDSEQYSRFDESAWADDDISGTKFDRTVRIVFAKGGVRVKGDAKKTVSVQGNHVTVRNATKENVCYKLSGTAQDGSFKIYSSSKLAIEIDGLNLTNPAGAAINNQSKKRCFVVVKGVNTLTDGTSYTRTPAGEDEKAALFSEGQLIFSGDGTLFVNAKGKSGISSDEYVRFMDKPAVNVAASSGHGIRGKEAVIISGGCIGVIASGDMKKGITSDSLVCINGGSTVVYMSGTAAYDEDDAEHKGTAGVKADHLFEMNGGTLDIVSFGTGGKGISGNGTACFNGGEVRVTAIGANYGSSGGRRFGPGPSSSSNSVSAKGMKFDGNIIFTGGKVSVQCASHEGIES
ncbi:MAG: carbohydrate-binding domain-containing protein, partial [Bacteroidaceae bacterium]|nr:carbohydrate-binding domain-containing protein [Bacteroidaceae bacterium]